MTLLRCGWFFTCLVHMERVRKDSFATLRTFDASFQVMRRQTEVELKLLQQDESVCQVRSNAALKK